jgi:hypothetical protein
MKSIGITIFVALSFSMIIEARAKDLRRHEPITLNSEPCAIYDCTDKPPVDPADDGYVPPHGEEHDVYGVDNGTDTIKGMQY